MPTTPRGYPTPAAADVPDVPTDMEELADAIDTDVQSVEDAIGTHAADTTSVHGIADTADLLTASSLAAYLPWTVDINPFSTAVTNTNWSAMYTNASANMAMGGYMYSTGAQNAEVGWDVVVPAGTWTVALLHPKGPDMGIVTASLDAASIGTIDLYAAGAYTYNNRSTITGVSVATSGKKRLLLKMATKNASSSSYIGGIQALRLFRTA